MQRKMLLPLVLSSFFIISACSDDKDTNAEKESDQVSTEQEATNKKSTDTDPSNENKQDETLEIQGENEMATKEMEDKVLSLQEVNEVTKDNYKAIQKLYTKYENIKNSSDAITKEVGTKIETLNKEAQKFEETLQKETKETVANAFLEVAMGLNAVSADGVVSKAIKFDKVELQVKDKAFAGTIDGQKFSVSRKLVAGEAPTQVTIKIYSGKKVVEELTVDVVEL